MSPQVHIITRQVLLLSHREEDTGHSHGADKVASELEGVGQRAGHLHGADKVAFCRVWAEGRGNTHSTGQVASCLQGVG